MQVHLPCSVNRSRSRRVFFSFACGAPQEVYDHLMKSSAGTAYWPALKSENLEPFRIKFVEHVARRSRGPERIITDRDYVRGRVRVE